jgi:hypothetical protein
MLYEWSCAVRHLDEVGFFPRPLELVPLPNSIKLEFLRSLQRLRRQCWACPGREVRIGRLGRGLPPVFLASILAVFLALEGLACVTCAAQLASDDGGAIRGVVINSVTHEPVARALVSSPDNRFATMTNSEGRFEFALPKSDSAGEEGSDLNGRGGGYSPSGGQVGGASHPYALMARKPGFLTDLNQQGNNLQDYVSKDGSKDVTLALTPEAVIAGTVTLPTSEAPDRIMLQIFRRQVQEGRGQWVPAGGSRTMSDGQFRFADLPAGTYKLLTTELLDSDPVTSDPRVDPFASEARGPLFGYPPVYYQSASDFGSASPIQLAAGETETVNLSLVKQPYYQVKVPVLGAPENGLGVSVYAHGRKGPGYSLGYDGAQHAVVGMLPNGAYTIELSGYGMNAVTGVQSITIKGAPVGGPTIMMVPNGSIAVNVKEEFTAADHSGPLTFSSNGRNAVMYGPRRYLNITLEPADDYGSGRSVSLREPKANGDEGLAIEGAPAGSYWVRVMSSRGYAASIRSGNLDLEHHPLVVGVGGAASPIEIAMRDDMGEISGTVEGVTPPALEAGGAAGGSWQGRVHVYCIPLADSGGQFTDIWVHPDGSFDSMDVPPGAYRVLAFDQVQTAIEYRNPEAMQVYDAKGSVVRVAGGQKEHVTLQLIKTSARSSE